jgi:hypothetical protein
MPHDQQWHKASTKEKKCCTLAHNCQMNITFFIFISICMSKFYIKCTLLNQNKTFVNPSVKHERFLKVY